MNSNTFSFEFTKIEIRFTFKFSNLEVQLITIKTIPNAYAVAGLYSFLTILSPSAYQVISSPLWNSLSLQEKAPKAKPFNHITSRPNGPKSANPKPHRSDPIRSDLPLLPQRPKPNRDRYAIPTPRRLEHLRQKLLGREAHRRASTITAWTVLHWIGAAATRRHGSGPESTSRVVKRRRWGRAGARNDPAVHQRRRGRGRRVGAGGLAVGERRAAAGSWGRGHPAESTRTVTRREENAAI